MAEDGRARRKAVKRAEIMAAAADIFFHEGYGRASMDQIIDKIGGSKRTLYNHFPSKQDLFRALVRNVSDRAVAAFQARLEHEDIRRNLIEMGMAYMKVLLSPDGIALFRAMISEAPHFPGLSKTCFENGPARASRHLARFLREQQRLGRVRVRDTQLAAEQFLGMVKGDLHLAAVLGAVRMPREEMIEETVVHAVDIFISGVVPGT